MHSDLFSEIAGRDRAPDEGRVLRRREIPGPPGRLVPTPGAPAVPRPHAAGIKTAREMTAALARLRADFAPYLDCHAPALSHRRPRVALNAFQWRVENAADRMEFSQVLEGGGEWTRVQIPHYGPPLGRAVTLYRATFDLERPLTAPGRVFLCFGGVDYACQVYVNGACVGVHEGFFETFEFDVTERVRERDNVLLVRVENDYPMLGVPDPRGSIDGDKVYAATGLGYDDPSHGWHHCPAGMGIHGPVHLEGRASVYVSDLWVRPLMAEAMAEVEVEICNAGGDPFADITTFVSIYGRNFPATVCARRGFKEAAPYVRGFGDLDHGLEGDVPVQMGLGKNQLRFRVPIERVREWSPESPWLYQTQVELAGPDGAVLDAAEVQFGMRSFRQDEGSTPKGKFYLNDREIRLRGANTMGHLERCVMTGDFDQLRDDILLAKLTHLNFLRLTQRPVCREVYDWCDRLGLLLQTDLPLFGTVRRNQRLEIVRQASRMERHIRRHPCAALVSFINEPFPAAVGKPHRFLLRDELNRMLEMCAVAVRQENPDRVIKCVDGDYDPPAPLGMPDNHCYPGWYVGHGVDLGALVHGCWLPVQEGWHYGCGEFGAEGLDSLEVMQSRYPADWRPEGPDAPWSPAVISESQSWKFHFLWYETPQTAAGWIRASQAHQAWVIRMMAEAFRRNAEMNTFAVHLFIDAWPAGWMKTLLDVKRVPKAAWFAYREALTPVAVSLRCDRTSFWSGESIPVELWLGNDTPAPLHGIRVVYDICRDSHVIAHGECRADIPACAPAMIGALDVPAPEVDHREVIEVSASVVDASGEVLHESTQAYDVFPRDQVRDGQPAVAMTSGSDSAAEFAQLLGLPVASAEPGAARVIWLVSYADYQLRAPEIDAAVRGGATAVVLGLSPGSYRFGDAAVVVKKAGMGPRHFVARAPGHPLVADFGPEDFRFWHFSDLGYPAPLLQTVLDAPGWKPILETGDGALDSAWRRVPAAVERADGRGCWRICQVELPRCVKTNPVARIFARRLFAA